MGPNCQSGSHDKNGDNSLATVQFMPAPLDSYSISKLERSLRSIMLSMTTSLRLFIQMKTNLQPSGVSCLRSIGSMQNTRMKDTYLNLPTNGNLQKNCKPNDRLKQHEDNSSQDRTHKNKCRNRGRKTCNDSVPQNSNHHWQQSIQHHSQFQLPHQYRRCKNSNNHMINRHRRNPDQVDPNEIDECPLATPTHSSVQPLWI